MTDELKHAPSSSSQSLSTDFDKRLERWKSIATIASAVAIPVVLALVGYALQSRVADEGIKKDYVQIAINILKEDPSRQDQSLREWAIEVVDRNSPVPLSAKVKLNLLNKEWGNAVWSTARAMCLASEVPAGTPEERSRQQASMLECVQKIVELLNTSKPNSTAPSSK